MSNSESKLGQRLLIDTHILDGEDTGTRRLWELHDGGWIQLCRSDAMDTELLSRADDEHRAALLSRSAEIVEVHGVGIWDHSRFGHMVVGSDADTADWDDLWKIMWPDADRGASSRTTQTRIRDAMHVWTAARYGYNAFVTWDGSGSRSGILTRASEIRDRFGLWVATPDEVLRPIERLKARYEPRLG